MQSSCSEPLNTTGPYKPPKAEKDKDNEDEDKDDNNKKKKKPPSQSWHHWAATEWLCVALKTADSSRALHIRRLIHLNKRRSKELTKTLFELEQGRRLDKEKTEADLQSTFRWLCELYPLLPDDRCLALGASPLSADEPFLFQESHQTAAPASNIT
jgi:hypothetical protein